MMWSELDWNVQAKRDGSARWKWPTTAVLAQTIDVAIGPLYPLGLACNHHEKELSSAGAKLNIGVDMHCECKHKSFQHQFKGQPGDYQSRDMLPEQTDSKDG